MSTAMWWTPQDFFDVVQAEFDLKLDVCADPPNAKCARFFTEEDDGLAQSWAPERCWMNPPYDRSIGTWMDKAWREHLLGATVVSLIPTWTDRKWWHEWVAGKAEEVRFIKGRMKFGNAKSGANFPNCLVIYRHTGHGAPLPARHTRFTHWDWRTK